MNVGAIEHLLERLRSRFGAALFVLQVDKESLSLQVGGDEAAVVGIRVADPSRPSFRVSYPKVEVKRGGRGRDHVDVVGAEDVLIEGVEWIVEQLAQHGLVRPEF